MIKEDQLSTQAVTHSRRVIDQLDTYREGLAELTRRFAPDELDEGRKLLEAAATALKELAAELERSHG